MDEIINKYRIFPRLLLVFYGWFLNEAHGWFVTLDKPTAEQSAYAIAVIGGVIGIVKYYIEHKAWSPGCLFLLVFP